MSTLLLLPRQPASRVVWLVAGRCVSFAGPLLPAAPRADGSAELAARSPPAALFPILKGSRWGFIDRSGRVVIPPRFESIVAAESDGEDRSARGGRGKPDELFMARSVEPETTAIVAVKSRGKWGFADRQGRLLTPRFDQVGVFSEGLAPVRQGALWGFVGTSGTLDVPLRFEH